MNSSEITLTESILDSRDVISRMEELESNWIDYFDELHEEEPAAGVDDPRLEAMVKESDYADEWEEYHSLKKLADEFEGYGGWDDGATLIHQDHFVNYIREIVTDTEDFSNIPDYVQRHIDWDGIAADMKHDYTEAGDYLMLA